MTNDGPPVSATLLLLREDPFEVLMVRRSSQGTFASSLVFPGGAIDSDDFTDDWASVVEDFADFDVQERARRIGALRETWEETSILVGGSLGDAEPTGTPTDLTFREFVVRSGVHLRLDALTQLAHWITPVTERRRFDTSFYVAAAPIGQAAVVDGNEIVEAKWVEPSVAAAAARRGDWPILFPTLMNLDRLAEGGSLDGVVRAALARPAFTVLPVIEVDETAGRTIVIPTDAGYAVTRFSPRP
jgi:8-oxo-dGTP pyrophosphatase MutT (NUDIX family)